MSLWQYISKKVKRWGQAKTKSSFDLLTLLCPDQKKKKKKIKIKRLWHVKELLALFVIVSFFFWGRLCQFFVPFTKYYFFFLC